jgi:hypothetical protein
LLQILAGLETDDEDEGMENAEGGTGPEEEEAPPSGRRLKRRKVEGEEPNEGMENVELQPVSCPPVVS